MPREPICQNVATRVEVDGQTLIAFAGCNYLGLAFDPRVLDVARDAVGRVGLSTSASRETSGNTVEHSALEDELGRFISGDDPSRRGLLLPDGYTANLAAVQGLSPGRACAVIDERAHASLFDAARSAGLQTRVYRHLDADSAAQTVAGVDGRVVLMTDGVFTADGAVAPLRALAEALREDDALVVDDCHGFCVMGRGGRGSCDAAGLNDPRVVVTTTLAKGLGCAGGVVVGPSAIIESVCRLSLAYVCTTPVSPVLAVAARAALSLVRSEPERVARLRENAGLLREAFAGLPGTAGGSPPTTPIAAIVPPGQVSGASMSRTLRASGVYVPLMSYPGGPSDEYFRASVTSEHRPAEIRLLGEALRASLAMDGSACPSS